MSTLFNRLRRVVPRVLEDFAQAIKPEEPEADPLPNPSNLFEARYDELTRLHREVKKHVSGVVYSRNKLSSRMEELKQEIKEIILQLEAELGDEELRSKKRELERELEILRPKHAELVRLAEKVKAALLVLQAERERILKAREKTDVADSLRHARQLVEDLTDRGLI